VCPDPAALAGGGQSPFLDGLPDASGGLEAAVDGGFGGCQVAARNARIVVHYQRYTGHEIDPAGTLLMRAS